MPSRVFAPVRFAPGRGEERGKWFTRRREGAEERCSRWGYAPFDGWKRGR
ncbi:hypothetical protein JMG10_18480 [Nostoc ellipsosporum NOK]|nr:hypothetical protein [Nostoc ellipsosporum NOK]